MTEQDEKNLDLLAIFHYVVAGLLALVGIFPLIYVLVGMLVILNPGFMPNETGSGEPMRAVMGGFMIVFGLFFSVVSWVLGALVFVSGRKLKARRSWLFCMIISCVMCLQMPFGTILGVFTLITLMNTRVKLAFQENS